MLEVNLNEVKLGGGGNQKFQEARLMKGFESSVESGTTDCFQQNLQAATLTFKLRPTIVGRSLQLSRPQLPNL